MENNELPIALFCDENGLEVSLSSRGLSVNTQTTKEFFDIGAITQIMMVNSTDVKGLAGSQTHSSAGLALPMFAIGCGILTALGGYLLQAPPFTYSGIALAAAGTLFFAKAHRETKKTVPLCYLRVQLADSTCHYAFNANVIKLIDMGMLVQQFAMLKKPMAEAWA